MIVLSLDVMDESGDHVTDYDHDVFKVRLDADGKEIHREKATGKMGVKRERVCGGSCTRC